MRRKTNGKLGVKDSILGTKARIVDSVLFVRFGVGNNSCKRSLRTGACGCGNGKERRKLMVKLHNASHLFNGKLRVGNSCRCGLCTVHRRAAAESDNALAVIVKIKLACVFDIVDSGVGLSSVINNVFDTVPFKSGKKAVKDMQTHKALIGNDENAPETL